MEKQKENYFSHLPFKRFAIWQIGKLAFDQGFAATAKTTIRRL
jgi:hypothetical protein